MLPGITEIGELPHTYFDALCLALGFLSFEELPKDERPDKAIWLEADEMKKHWKAVERKRDADMKGGGDIRDEEIDGDVSQNDLTEEYLGVTRP